MQSAADTTSVLTTMVHEGETSLSQKIQSVLDYSLFELHQTPVTLKSLLLFVLVFAAIYFFSKLLNRSVLRPVLRRFQLDEGVSLTLTRLTHYFIMAIGALIAFQFVGIDLSGLAVIFGFLSVGIGFGLQNVTSNFIAGLILLFERPIKIGDRVLVHDTEGDVLDINIRSTTIRSLQNVDIIVPNSDFISNAVVNWSHGDLRIRMSIDVGVSYSSNIDDVLAALKEVGSEHPEVIQDPAPRVLFRNFGDSSWNMSLVIWAQDASEHHRLRSDLNIAIVRKFRDFGIEIPFPQRDLHLRSATELPIETRDSGEGHRPLPPDKLDP